MVTYRNNVSTIENILGGTAIVANMFFNWTKRIFYTIPRNWIICKRYPFLKINSGVHPYFDNRYEKTWLDFLPIGWQKRFGWKLVHDIDKYLKEHNITDYQIKQVKEKFGMLCWYDNAPNELQGIIDNYIYISKHVCVECGANADFISTGYVLPYCNKCAEAIRDERGTEFQSAHFLKKYPGRKKFKYKTD